MSKDEYTSLMFVHQCPFKKKRKEKNNSIVTRSITRCDWNHSGKLKIMV